MVFKRVTITPSHIRPDSALLFRLQNDIAYQSDTYCSLSQFLSEYVPVALRISLLLYRFIFRGLFDYLKTLFN
jgi:hypothetical protein